MIERKTDSGTIRAEMETIDNNDRTSAHQGRYPYYYWGDNTNSKNGNTASFRQRPLVVYEGSQETTQKPRFVYV